jgi:hypothetical protein
MQRFDPDRIAQEASVCVTYWDDLPWLGMYTRSARGVASIALRSSLAIPDLGDMRRLILAHALAYHMQGATPTLLPMRCSGRFPPDDAYEVESLRFAGMQLCPPVAAAIYWRGQEKDFASAVHVLAVHEQLPEAFAASWLTDLASRGLVRTR